MDSLAITAGQKDSLHPAAQPGYRCCCLFADPHQPLLHCGAANLRAYSLLTDRCAARVVGEVGNGLNECNWVENSTTDARHVDRLHSGDVSARYIEI